MDNTKKERFEIKDEDKDFFQEFMGVSGDIEEDSLAHKKIISALEKSHDIRKFEIELYWKRATYFFAFFTVITAAFGYLYTTEKYSFLAPALAIIGSVFSICFYYVNIGSKYWQENWEFIIDKIEYYVTGNLYKLFFYENDETKRPSVTKINSFISCFIMLIWYSCFILAIIQIRNVDLNIILLYIIANLAISILTVCLCHKTVKTMQNNKNKNKNKNNPSRVFRFRKPNYTKS
ncbi:RipA family octameric membrane protein [Scandinavium manionii]|uniref:RipA family octameric membrane protein n=1 Tax=Scandinavium manionii TaxID=2926520 RepID=UPI00216596F4|nr:hypothetical protein [Scandinavium manionii]MCS2164610.1 hypothetical protein [Scandinavium manionii]